MNLDPLVAGTVVTLSAILPDGWVAVHGGRILQVGRGGRTRAGFRPDGFCGKPTKPDRRRESISGADIMIAAPCDHRYDPIASGHAFTSWSPYEGRQFARRTEATFLRGGRVFSGRDVLAPGNGRFVRPPA